MNRNKLQRLVVLWVGLLASAFVLGALPAESHAGGVGGTDDALESATFKRDPFCPVGYVSKRAKAAAKEKTAAEPHKPALVNDWDNAMKKVVINGVSSRGGDEFYAVINGQVKRVGDSVSVDFGGTIYTWAVDGIQPPGSVKLRRMSTR
ncbi:hypothetical protein [Pontiella sp.]|uniref:hypothetical protein n=1 Tax=Pontiella sp. TaxID=2837462 RepID=UPI0035654442